MKILSTSSQFLEIFYEDTLLMYKSQYICINVSFEMTTISIKLDVSKNIVDEIFASAFNKLYNLYMIYNLR